MDYASNCNKHVKWIKKLFRHENAVNFWHSPTAFMSLQSPILVNLVYGLSKYTKKQKSNNVKCINVAASV